MNVSKKFRFLDYLLKTRDSANTGMSEDFVKNLELLGENVNKKQQKIDRNAINWGIV